MTEIQTLLAPTEVLEMQTQLTPTEILAACTGSPIHTGPYSHIFQLPRYPQSLVIKRMRLSFSIIKDERILREQMIAMQCMNDPTRSPYLVEIKGGEIIGEFVYLTLSLELITALTIKLVLKLKRKNFLNLLREKLLKISSKYFSPMKKLKKIQIHLKRWLNFSKVMIKILKILKNQEQNFFLVFKS